MAIQFAYSFLDTYTGRCVKWLHKIWGDAKDQTQLRFVDAKKSESDILLEEQMEKFAKEHSEQIKISHVLSHPREQ
ncbi:uncharacterized protein RAG0_02369 [Rhynchosporium agropyri]|uniref:Oxidoreductase FAD/NAD(P)-binding domain-containing protein n=1 Tax=Rhynchosporium agropyri TaxID=914238 RepID=A0A1E1K144_9HELO|nr:uncharacterized protein RAG0_02369 [Rhynchosporium agropyri]